MSMRCACWPLSQWLLGATHSELLWDRGSSSRTNSWPMQMSFEQVHERVQLCQDPQTEFSVLRESLGVSRVNHILRVHGHTILQEKRAAEINGGVGQRSSERLFPGFTEDSSEQAPLSAGQPGIGYKWARSSLVKMQRCKMQSQVAFLPKQLLVTRLAAVIEAATAYLEAWDGEEESHGEVVHSESSPRQRTKRGGKQLKGTMAPSSQNPTVSEHTLLSKALGSK